MNDPQTGLKQVRRALLGGVPRRRRSSVAVLFTHGTSCLHLATTVLTVASDEWETSRTYLNSPLALTLLVSPPASQ
jgi:hypothetical protein